MAARERGGRFELPSASHAPATTLLKRHKALPRPREGVRPAHAAVPATRPTNLALDTAVPSEPSSATTSPHALKHASRGLGIPVLPPTPPTRSRQSSGSRSTISAAPRREAREETFAHISSAPGTPPNQRSPPTPDVTPPRVRALTLRPPRERAPSTQSRTDSFKTARETPYGSEEDVSIARSMLHSTGRPGARVAQPRRRSERWKEVGLGLGLESDNESATTPRVEAAPLPGFAVFDGEWGQAVEEVSEVEREWDDNLMRNVVVRKRRARKPYAFTDGPSDEVVEDDIVSPAMATRVVRGLPLQERIARHRLDRDTEALGVRAQPSAVPDFDSPTSADVRRFSAMSGRSTTSTVIEAMVVDSPPGRRQTLRRSKKLLGLRDLSDQSSVPSGPSSVISSEPQHKLLHKKPQIPGRRHRSLASNATVSTTSSSGRSRRQVLSDGGIPVVVVPSRRSSTKPSKAPSLRSTSSHKAKRSMSLSSAPLSHSSKFNEPGYFGSIPPRKRTMSESETSGHSVRTIDFPPHIPTRRSSLSAPTSRNTSRAGSLTAESLKAHNLMHQHLMHQQEAIKPEAAPSQPYEPQREPGQAPRLAVVDHTGDPFFGNRRSTQATPFSQLSYETAGTAAEVSEAMAVSIFPHQNSSVLVIQQPPAPAQQPPSLGEIIDRSHPETAVGGRPAIEPVTPPQPIYPMDDDSPLRNPRAAPEPPAIQFIPPTPAAVEDEEDGEVDHGHTLSPSDTPRRSTSLMRRAFSNRRNSETGAPPSQGFLKRTLSLGSRRRDSRESTPRRNTSTLYPSVSDRPADDSKLHPFWRPTNFWDDLEDHDDASGEYGGRFAMIDNRPSPPRRSLSGKLKRTFAILPIKDDHHYRSYSDDRRMMLRSIDGSLRAVKQGDTSGLRMGRDGRLTYAPSDYDSRPFGYGFPEGNGGKMYTIPGLGIRVEYTWWDGMKRRLSQRKKEQRSEKLRASIGHPRGVQNGTDDVLRRRGDA